VRRVETGAAPSNIDARDMSGDVVYVFSRSDLGNGYPVVSGCVLQSHNWAACDSAFSAL